MANEKWLIDANEIVYQEVYVPTTNGAKKVWAVTETDIDEMPNVDAVKVVKYKALLEKYNELRENFVDYVCSGVQNVAPYCLNRCEECVDGYGWCKHNDKCQGFNPAEVILMDGERRCRDAMQSNGLIEQKHGHWVPDKADILFHCSECETQISTDWDYDDLAWNYCPHCGAKMDGERKDK